MIEQKAKTETQRQLKFDGKVQDNYDKYLKEPQKIGFTQGFKMKRVLKTYEIPIRCLNYDVTVLVHYGDMHWQDSKYACKTIETSELRVGDRLPMGGFGSHAYHDEAKTMEAAIVEVCKKMNLMICNKINSWPFAKAIVQENIYTE